MDRTHQTLTHDKYNTRTVNLTERDNHALTNKLEESNTGREADKHSIALHH